jgi:NIPSNAP protein
MKTKAIAVLLCLSSLLAGPLAAQPAAGGRVFELRTYTTPPGKLDALNTRFREHTLALFKKHGMEVVGFWEPVDKEAGAGEKLVYLLSHQSRAAAEAAWKAFRADPEWLKAKADSEKDGPILLKFESVFLTATDYSPLK